MADLYVDEVVTNRRIMLPQSDVDELDSELTVCRCSLDSTRTVSSGRVAEREVRSDEVGAVLVSVRSRRATHVNHLWICIHRPHTDTHTARLRTWILCTLLCDIYRHRRSTCQWRNDVIFVDAMVVVRYDSIRYLWRARKTDGYEFCRPHISCEICPVSDDIKHFIRSDSICSLSDYSRLSVTAQKLSVKTKTMTTRNSVIERKISVESKFTMFLTLPVNSDNCEWLVNRRHHLRT